MDGGRQTIDDMCWVVRDVGWGPTREGMVEECFYLLIEWMSPRQLGEAAKVPVRRDPLAP
jgi:hypothetical protein